MSFLPSTAVFPPFSTASRVDIKEVDIAVDVWVDPLLAPLRPFFLSLAYPSTSLSWLLAAFAPRGTTTPFRAWIFKLFYERV